MKTFLQKMYLHFEACISNHQFNMPASAITVHLKKKNEKKVNFMIKILICTIKDLNTCMNMINDLIKKKFEKFFRRTNKILQITLFIPQV